MTGRIACHITIDGEHASLSHDHLLVGMTAKQVGFAIGMLVRYGIELRELNQACLAGEERRRFDDGYAEAMSHDQRDVDEGFKMRELPKRNPHA